MAEVRRLYRVEGFDITGRRQFGITVHAFDKDDARGLAGDKLKQTPRGAQQWSTAMRLQIAHETGRLSLAGQLLD